MIFWRGAGCLPSIIAALIALVVGGGLAAIWTPLFYVGLALGVAAYFPLRWAQIASKRQTRQACPHCRSLIPVAATVCRRCGRNL